MSDDTTEKSVPVATRPQGPVIIHATPPPPPKEVRAAARPSGPQIVLPPRPKEVRPAGVQVHPQQRPLRQEPRRQPQPRPTRMGRLGDEALAKILAAVASGNERELAAAVQAGVALRLDHPLVLAESKRQQKANSAVFATRIKSARRFLARARLLINEEDIEQALAALTVAINRAVKIDGKSRDREWLLHTIGTDEAEMGLLPYLYYTTITFHPDGTIEPRSGTRTRATQSATVLEPIRQIAPGEKIDAPRAKIVYRMGEQYGETVFIQFPDDRHAFTGVVDGESVTMMGTGQYALMKRERMKAEDIVIVGTGENAQATEYHLIGSDRWVYAPHVADGNYTGEPLIGSSTTGFTTEPSSTHIVMEKYVQQPLFVFAHEVSGQRFCYVAVQMKLGNVVVYEVPWSDDVLIGTEEDPILELARGFIPADEPEPTTTSELVTEAPIATV